MHNWVDMAVLLEIQQMNTVVVCFYMVKKKPTWKGSAKIHSWSGSKQSKPIMY